MVNKIAVILLLSAIPVLFQCVSTGNGITRPGSVLTGDSTDSVESTDKIDKWKTFEVFFTLDNPEDCIRININSEAPDEVENRIVLQKTYFIVEKAVDISRFSGSGSVLYSEIGRSFDLNWITRPTVEICSSDTDPIKKLNKSGRFRIRFTVFKDIDFKYTVNIYSRYKINIVKKNAGL